MWIAIGLIFMAAGYLFLVFPTPAGRKRRAVFAGRAFAHRGLHDNENGPPENSLAAFSAAAKAGFAVELDVQLTKDKQLVVFHDQTLERVCGENRRVRDCTYEQLRRYRLFGSDQTIPLFSEALGVMGARQPLIVELKSDGDRQWGLECCRITYMQLKGYGGEYCIESFDPAMVRWFAVYAPKITRGQLSMSAREYGKKLPAVKRFMISRLMNGMINRPHFVAYQHTQRNLSLRIVKRLGAMSIVWTCRDAAEHGRLAKTEDGIIFEGYRPPPRF